MSGICGIVQWDGSLVRGEWIRGMQAEAAYRGPDGSWVELAGAAGVGYQSREITPESVGERQPVVHRASGVMVAVDARLDNREEMIGELGEQLRELGGSGDGSGVVSVTDAQLVLASYLRWGERCAERLLGDYAFSVWDARNAAVVLCRDAMGMRSLYYRDERERVIWATEVKQILAVPGVDAEINETAVATHLSGAHVPLGMSFYRGIEQVEPAHVVVVRQGKRSNRRYWEVDSGARVRYRDEREYGERFREIFVQAVEDRLRSVKPVGISLSGGMDSGSVASTVGWLYEHGESRRRPEFRAYSWAFEKLSQCDERAVSGIVAERYRIPVTDIAADDAWPLRDYPHHGPPRDTPFFGIFQVLLDHTVNAAARDGVGVLLSGDRGDLMVGGSVMDLPGLFAGRHWASLSREFAAFRDVAGLPAHRAAWSALVRPALARGANAVGIRARAKQRLWNPQLPPHVRSDFIRRAVDPAYLPYSLSSSAADRAARARHRYVFAELHMDGMVWSERTNAQAGVGFADAWSDRRIAEFVLSVPSHVVHRLSEPKRILRSAMDGIMPPDALAAARKVIPRPLYLYALRDGSRDTVVAHTRRMECDRYGWIDEKEFHRNVMRVLEGEIDQYDLWPALSLEMWMRRYFG